MISKSYVVQRVVSTFRLRLTSLSTLALDFVNSVGLQEYDTKMMGQRSILAFRFQVRGSVFLQSTKINDDSNVRSCYK